MTAIVAPVVDNATILGSLADQARRELLSLLAELGELAEQADQVALEELAA
jgi:hypothetical protein